MALIVETGVGVANADAYAPMAFFDAYMAAHGRTEWAAANEVTVREPAVRRGTRAIDILFYSRWPGERTFGREQVLAWPRLDVVSTEGIDLDSDEIPIELKQATAEAAWLEFLNPGSLLPIPEGQVESSVTVGPISVSFANRIGAGARLQLETHIPLFEALLWNLLLSSAYQKRWLDRV